MEFLSCIWVCIRPVSVGIQHSLTLCSGPLHLSTFTLDEFEGAIRHSQPDVPCPLISEVHSTLIYNLRTVPFTRHSAIISLFDSLSDADIETFGISTSDLIDASRDIGNNWERAPLRHAEGREGWEESLIGCLKDVSGNWLGWYK